MTKILHRHRSWVFRQIQKDFFQTNVKACPVINFRILFEPRDLWVGIYWDGNWPHSMEVCVTLIPTIVFHFAMFWSFAALGRRH